MNDNSTDTNTKPIPLTMSFFPPESAVVRVRWESPVLGLRHSSFIMPYCNDDLGLVTRALDQAQSPRGRQSPTFSQAERTRLESLGLLHPRGWIMPDAHQRVGHALYHALVADPEGSSALATARDYATIEQRPLALNLRLPADEVELAALPWEALWDNGVVPVLLSRGGLAACTRYLDLPQALPHPHRGGVPLRILALAPHANISEQARLEEQQARRAAWEPLITSGRVEMEEISPVTRAALVDALQTRPLPDIIHYYGHGRYEGGEGALLLDGEEGETCWTHASSLAALVGGVGMVVLFACQGGMVGGGHSAGMLSGLAPALSAAGVPVVFGMQLSVRVQAATRAASVMYRAIAAGWSVQQAVSLTRQALYVEEESRASWYVPVLYIRSHATEPVYLVTRSEQQHANQTHAANDAPTRPRALGTAHQAVVAHHNSRVRGVTMQGGTSVNQLVGAHGQSIVDRASLRAAGPAHQHIRAEAASEIADTCIEQDEG